MKNSQIYKKNFFLHVNLFSCLKYHQYHRNIILIVFFSSTFSISGGSRFIFIPVAILIIPNALRYLLIMNYFGMNTNLTYSAVAVHSTINTLVKRDTKGGH